MADLTEAVSGLIERIEAAGGPDRQLDMLIENALGLAIFDRDPAVGFGDADYNRRDPKPYTASIDAALSLVPAGRRMVVQQRRSYEPFWVSFMLDGGTEYDATGRAKTLALAIAAAALRARETTPSIKGGDRG